MDKIIYSGCQDELLIRNGGVLSRFFDSTENIKSASSSAISEALMRAHRPDKDHYGIHLIAMGSSEYYSFNRNGDWWKKQDLIDRHHTFVKYGHYFEEHKHHSPSLKIGDIAASAYNTDQERVELIIHGDKKKDEAGYEAAKAGKPLTFSMSAKVAGDICSCCDKFSKSSDDYCIHAAQHMTQWLHRFGKFAYVINVRPKFFDLSKVANRADRIAVHIEYMFNDEMKKAASALPPSQFSDQLAKAAGVRELPEPLPVENEVWLKKLAALEEYVEAVELRPDNVAKDPLFHFYKQAARFASGTAVMDEATLAELKTLDPEILFHEMAKRASVWSFQDFYAYANDVTVKDAAADPVMQHAREHCLSTVFRDLQRDQENWEAIENFKAASTERMSVSLLSHRSEQALTKVASATRVDPAGARDRLVYNALSNNHVIKSASAELTQTQVEKAKFLARVYGMYKLAFCEAASSLNETDFRNDAVLLLVLKNN